MKTSSCKEIRVLGSKNPTILDEDDYIRFGAFNWYVNNNGYVVTDVSKPRRSEYGNAKVRLHRLIMVCPKGMDVDHANGNKLDNRKVNLRICTRGQNLTNKRSVGKLKGSYYRGNAWNYTKPWFAAIQINGKQKYLGSFKTEEEAHERYKYESIKRHGEYSVFNRKEEENENKWPKGKRTPRRFRDQGTSLEVRP